MRRKIRFSFSFVLQCLSYLAAGVCAASLIAIVAYILINGLPYVSWQFLFGKYTFYFDGRKADISIFPAMLATLLLVFFTLLFCIPIGVAAAVYIAEYTKRKNKFVKYIKVAVDTLTGVPSLIYGLFGAMFFGAFLKLGSSVMTGALTMTVMLLPFVIRSTEEALKAVPQMYREGSYALGAGRSATVFKIALPGALPGIFTSVILSVGRIIGESAAILFTVGWSAFAFPDLVHPTTNLSGMVYYLYQVNRNAAAAGSAVLLVLVVLLNVIAAVVGARLNRKRK
ncbi:MAG: phosphate ABC transporter permease PstA [Clostridiales bacterium]|jgi:phosphate transport system permease protein|nr:phosphate ABC transporter permease PstA [Clostridiales bacterium]